MKPQVTLHFKWPPYGWQAMKECSIQVGGTKRYPLMLNISWLILDEREIEYAVVHRHPGGLVKGREIRRIK